MSDARKDDQVSMPEAGEADRQSLDRLGRFHTCSQCSSPSFSFPGHFSLSTRFCQWSCVFWRACFITVDQNCPWLTSYRYKNMGH